MSDIIRFPLPNGKHTIIDAHDADLVAGYRWHTRRTKYGASYVCSRYKEQGVNRHVLMHRLIIGAAPGQMVDHINRDTLDNRRSNLRIVTRTQNSWNRDRVAYNTSGFIGVVCRGKRQPRWIAMISMNGKNLSLGSFGSPIAAAKAYDAAARQLRGEFAVLNFPEES